MQNSIVEIKGIQVGHAQNLAGATGCTAVICHAGAVTGVACTGGSPGTRELSALSPENTIPMAHGVYLGGGSAYGLAGADGVMQYLEEQGVGFDVGIGIVPIVPGAILFDLAVGDGRCRPDAAMGYTACLNCSDSIVGQGSVGAGTGATVGFKGNKLLLMKGGIGTACVASGRLRVGALVAVNCLGDVVDPTSGTPLAGMYHREKREFLGAARRLVEDPENINQHFLRNTTIGVVATNANLTKSEATRVAIMAHDGYAKTISPSHTTSDGDTLFCMATGELDVVLDAVGVLAVEAVSQAVINAVLHAAAVDGIPAHGDIFGTPEDRGHS